jgi:hypothetical protein
VVLALAVVALAVVVPVRPEVAVVRYLVRPTVELAESIFSGYPEHLPRIRQMPFFVSRPTASTAVVVLAVLATVAVLALAVLAVLAVAVVVVWAVVVPVRPEVAVVRYLVRPTVELAESIFSGYPEHLPRIRQMPFFVSRPTASTAVVVVALAALAAMAVVAALAVVVVAAMALSAALAVLAALAVVVVVVVALAALAVVVVVVVCS